MVYFSCSGCNESLKKPKVAKHLSFCRRCYMLTCLDCQKDFTPESYVTHNQCVSELEKYSGRNYVEPANANKGQKKQLGWMDSVRDAVEEYPKQHPLDCREQRQVNSLLSSLLRFDNIPRKKAKFENFVRSAIGQFRRDQAAIDGAWAAISAPREHAVEPAAVTTKRKVEEGEEEEVEERKGKENEEKEKSTEPKKKKRKEENEEESENQPMEPKKVNKRENGLPQEPQDVLEGEEEEKKKKKKKKRKRKEESEEEPEDQPSEIKKEKKTENGVPQELQDVLEGEEEEKKKKKKRKRKEEGEEEPEDQPSEIKKEKKTENGVPQELQDVLEGEEENEEPTEPKKKRKRTENGVQHSEDQETPEGEVELKEKAETMETEQQEASAEQETAASKFVLTAFVKDLLQRRGSGGISLAKLEKRTVRAYMRSFARPNKEPRPERVRRKLPMVIARHFRQIDGRVYERQSI